MRFHSHPSLLSLFVVTSVYCCFLHFLFLLFSSASFPRRYSTLPYIVSLTTVQHPLSQPAPFLFFFLFFFFFPLSVPPGANDYSSFQVLLTIMRDLTGSHGMGAFTIVVTRCIFLRLSTKAAMRCAECDAPSLVRMNLVSDAHRMTTYLVFQSAHCDLPRDRGLILHLHRMKAILFLLMLEARPSDSAMEDGHPSIARPLTLMLRLSDAYFISQWSPFWCRPEPLE